MEFKTLTPLTLGRAVQERRSELGLTQQQLADQAFVSRHWLIDLERGAEGASIGKVLMVLHVLGLDTVLREKGV
ncbi:MAG: helix-turn-helix domain-containing protein [Propionibacteriaceae bacterium]|nr:helix-turn-helix domain-containing protein [Propionibacteriaceae bacterium]